MVCMLIGFLTRKYKLEAVSSAYWPREATKNDFSWNGLREDEPDNPNRWLLKRFQKFWIYLIRVRSSQINLIWSNYEQWNIAIWISKPSTSQKFEENNINFLSCSRFDFWIEFLLLKRIGISIQTKKLKIGT